MRHPLLSPSCMAAVTLCLQWAASSRASGTGRGGPALAARLGLPLTEGEMAGRDPPSHGHTVSLALGPQCRRDEAPPARRCRHQSSASSPAFGETAPRNGKNEGGPVVAFVTEVTMRLWRKSCQAEQGTVPLPAERCFRNDSVWDCSHGACGCLTHHLDLCYYGPVLLLCKVTCILVTMMIAILLLARCVTSYQSWRESKRRSKGWWPGCASSMVWGAAAYLSCAICLQAYEPGEALKMLSCSHIYHRKCIDRWHRAQPGSKTCPLCQRSVTAVVLIPLGAPNSKQE